MTDYLLISDLDDTLLGDAAALRRFADWQRALAGRLAVVYSSGRFVDSILESVEKTRLPEPVAVIGGVGTQVCDYPGLEPYPGWIERMARNWDGQRVRDLLSAEADLELQPEVHQSRFKVSWYLHDAEQDRLDQLRERLRAEGIAADLVYSSRRDLDVLPAGIDKGSAADFLAERLGYERERVLVSGNSSNDRALFEHRFAGIVVGNAHDELKAVRDEVDRVYIAEATHAAGVIEGIRHWTDLPEQPEPVPLAETPRRSREEGYRRALAVLRECSTEHGFLAAATQEANYHRVWGRDSAILGLAALMSGEEDLIATLRASLLTLADYQGEHGEIPSNVDPVADRVSYGGTAGRVDADLWFVIACGAYWRATRDEKFLARVERPLERVRFLLGCWEFNGRGLLYVPQTGDWADEYIHHGYVLTDQVLYLQAQRELAAIHRDRHGSEDHRLHDRIARLHHLIRANYWFADGEAEGDELPDDVYHPVLYEKGRRAYAAAHHRFWLPFFAPTGYGLRFDALANILVSLFDVADDEQRRQVDRLSRWLTCPNRRLLPAFAPVITPQHRAWKDLQMTFSYEFRNEPYRYQNGGLWPFINGFYAADLARRGQRELAERYCDAIHRANATRFAEVDEHHREEETSWAFPEFLDGRSGAPGGVAGHGWSAAGAVIAQCALEGRPLFGGEL